MYLIFIFSEIFLKIYFYLYSLTTRQYKHLRSAYIWNKTCWKFVLWWEGGLQKLAFYIFDIRIRPSCLEQIYSIFVFGQVPRNKYIQYSYLVKLVETNIFDIRIQWKFHFRIYSYSYSVKNLIFVLHWVFLMNKIGFFLLWFFKNNMFSVQAGQRLYIELLFTAWRSVTSIYNVEFHRKR